MRSRSRWVLGAVLGALALLAVVAVLGVRFIIDEPLRRRVEAGMNAALKGYTVRIGKLRFNPIGLSNIYEGIVAGAGKILTNPPRDQIATSTDLSGPLADPHTSILQIAGNLVGNAFFKAILPGLERGRHRD